MISVTQDALLDYRELYYRWEHEQWAAGAIDLSMDRREWDERVSPSLKRAFLWGSSVAFVAREDEVRDALVSFVDAAPTEEQQVFLTTQLVDTARHTVFFDRFCAEVLGEADGDMESRSEARSHRLNDGLRSLLSEVPATSDGILSDPSDPEALIEGMVLYHLVIAVALAATTQGSLLAQLPNEGALPGLREGLGAVARDQERHADFAVRFLGDLIAQDQHHRDVIQIALGRYLPLGLAALEPPSGTADAADQQVYRLQDLKTGARRALSERLNVIGVELPS